MKRFALSSIVVPAKAGTHNHRRQYFYTLLVVSLFLKRRLRIMGPCFRRDDIENNPRTTCLHKVGPARQANQQKPVKSLLQKYSDFPKTQITPYQPPSRPLGGATHDRHDRGTGCGGRGGADNERH
jgi:hypothetical protein